MKRALQSLRSAHRATNLPVCEITRVPSQSAASFYQTWPVGIRCMSSAANSPLAPVSKKAKAHREEKRKLMAFFPDIVRDLTEIGSHSDLPDTQRWYSKVLHYNVTGGKLNRGLTIPLSYELLSPSDQYTEDNIRKAYLMGWCVELLQSFFLITDDIIDGSPTRRGKPAWYLQNELGYSAINDAVMVESGVYKLLKQHFSQEPYYVSALELFHDVTLKTSLGQSLDIRSSRKGEDGNPQLEKFTMNRYSTIVKYKTAYYSFYLPVALALHMAGTTNLHGKQMAGVVDEEMHRQAKAILIEIGHFFQAQDDYLDVFGDVSVTGKNGTDIQDGKCTWLIVVAMQRASPSQKEVLKANYGKDDPDCIAKVKDVFKEMNLESVYKAYENSSNDMIRIHVQQTSRGLNHQVFFQLMDKIYKRNR